MITPNSLQVKAYFFDAILKTMSKRKQSLNQFITQYSKNKYLWIVTK